MLLNRVENNSELTPEFVAEQLQLPKERIWGVATEWAASANAVTRWRITGYVSMSAKVVNAPSRNPSFSAKRT